jgi:hypothetical protein
VVKLFLPSSMRLLIEVFKLAKGQFKYVVFNKAVPVTGCAGPQFSETLKISHYLDNRLTDDTMSVLVAGRPLPPRKISGIHFC